MADKNDEARDSSGSTRKASVQDGEAHGVNCSKRKTSAMDDDDGCSQRSRLLSSTERHESGDTSPGKRFRIEGWTAKVEKSRQRLTEDAKNALVNKGSQPILDEKRDGRCHGDTGDW